MEITNTLVYNYKNNYDIADIENFTASHLINYNRHVIIDVISVKTIQITS